MKISYDSVSSEYLYPLSKKDIGSIREIVPYSIISRITRIRFGCNRKTTQEGRLVKRGDCYEIRINFCLDNLRSMILSEKKRYVEQIRNFGGIPDSTTGFITWKLPDAKRYAFFLILHEIAHVIYCENYMNGQMGGRGTVSEEQWCDDYAMNATEELSEKK